MMPMRAGRITRPGKPGCPAALGMMMKSEKPFPIRYSDFDAGRCCGITANSLRAARVAGVLARQCPNPPLAGDSLCLMHGKARRAGTVVLHPAAPAAAAA